MVLLIFARRSSSVDAHVHVDVLPVEEDLDERDEEARLAAHRLRLRVRAPRDRGAHPGAADVREVLGRLVACPRSVRHPAEVDHPRRCRSTATAAASAGFVGIPYVRGKSIPVPRIISATSTSRPTMPLTTSWNAPSPPTTTSSSCAVVDRLARELRQMAGRSRRRARRRRAPCPRRRARARASAFPSTRSPTPG